MTTKSTAGTSSTTAVKKRRTNKSAGQVHQQGVLKTLGNLWRTMDMTSKSTFQVLAKALTAPPGRLAVTPRISAYSTFIQVNTGLVLAGLPPVTIAPDPATAPPALGSPVLTALMVGLSSSLSLNLYGYPSTVLVYCSRPLLAGTDTYAAGSFTFLGSIASTIPTTDNITQMYLKKYAPPTAGTKIALRVVGISPGGLRSAPNVVIGIVRKTALARRNDGTDMELKAA